MLVLLELSTSMLGQTAKSLAQKRSTGSTQCDDKLHANTTIDVTQDDDETTTTSPLLHDTNKNKIYHDSINHKNNNTDTANE